MASSILNSDDGVISGTSGIKSTGGDDGVLLIQTNGTTAQTVDAGQRTKFPTTIGVGGATPSTSGSGITFPATQSASTNANTLDDYEEGTWTPTIIGSDTAGTATYSGQIASYTKIGRMVQIVGYINWSSGTGTGAGMRIAGLPFTVLSSANADDAACSIYTGNITTSASTVIGATFRTNNTNIGLLEIPVGTGTTGNCAYDAAGYAFFAGTYVTA